MIFYHHFFRLFVLNRRREITLLLLPSIGARASVLIYLEEAEDDDDEDEKEGEGVEGISLCGQRCHDKKKS